VPDLECFDIKRVTDISKIEKTDRVPTKLLELELSLWCAALGRP